MTGIDIPKILELAPSPAYVIDLGQLRHNLAILDEVQRAPDLTSYLQGIVDEPGFAIGTEAERAGTIRAGMNAMFAVMQTGVPWFACVLRRSYGVAQGIHLGPGATVVA